MPKEDEVLVKVHATTVDALGLRIPRSRARSSRASSPASAGRSAGSRGMEFAGVVEAVGLERHASSPWATRCSGCGRGANAEYVCVREQGALAHKPERPELRGGRSRPRRSEHRACVPQQGRPRARKAHRRLRRIRLDRNGRRAARESNFGAHVTAVCNTKNVELVRSLGADEVVDYLKEDFTKNGETYDVDLRRGRQALVQTLPRFAQAGRDVYLETDLGFMWHVPLARPRDAPRRQQARDAPDPEVHEGGRPPT